MYEKILHTDVAVIGGGVAGCSAAMTCSRRGLRTMLLDRGISLGGLATNGYVPQIVGLTEGNVGEFIDRLAEAGVGVKNPATPDNRGVFDPEYAKFMLETMVTEYGGRILYDSVCEGVTVEDGRIKEAVFYTKGGKMAVRAKLYIDATGDSDVCYMAGVPYENGGREYAGLNMSSTIGTRWAGVNNIVYQKAVSEWAAQQVKEGVPPEKRVHLAYHLEDKAIANGDLPHHIGNRVIGVYMVHIPNTPQDDLEFCTYVFHSYFTDNTDVENISRQVLEQHQQMQYYEKFMRKYLPGFEKVRLIGMGSIPGSRDSRRMFGEYMLRDYDLACGTKFEDGIARFPEIFDTHHPTSFNLIFQRHIHLKNPGGSAICRPSQCGVEMHPFGLPAGDEARPDPRDYCEIPYRALVPQGIDNLLAAGRCVSAEFHASTATRLIAPAMSTGQAAGIAADLIFRNGCIPARELDGRLVRQALKSEGVDLDSPPSGFWGKMREKQGTPVVTSADTISLI